MPFWFGTRFVDSIISLNQRTGGDFYEGRDKPSVRVLKFGDNTYNENQELTGISIAITDTEWRDVPETYTLIPPIPSLNSFPEYWSEDTKERIRHFHQKIKMRYEQYQQAYRQHSHHQVLRHSIADARMSIAMINELIEQEVSGSTGYDYRTSHLTDIARNPLNYSLIWNKVAALYLISKKSLPGSISMKGSQWLTYAVLAITLCCE